ncbi:hypothetical protein DFH94DRAFT_744585 [Russula ochroleuca]|uniref:Uncharacterized protein n=1 Tax=Russula ochroleuca TaxID=152965 RepID=A0A9P5MVC3_9AGAM|nr:hypothetical protein DFH94DRAFT_744585 [Russula ochroleuca]
MCSRAGLQRLGKSLRISAFIFLGLQVVQASASRKVFLLHSFDFPALSVMNILLLQEQYDVSGVLEWTWAR